MKNRFEHVARIRKEHGTAILEVGAKDAPFLGRNLGWYYFDTPGDAQNAYKLALDILDAADNYRALLVEFQNDAYIRLDELVDSHILGADNCAVDAGENK